MFTFYQLAILYKLVMAIRVIEITKNDGTRALSFLRREMHRNTLSSYLFGDLVTIYFLFALISGPAIEFEDNMTSTPQTATHPPLLGEHTIDVLENVLEYNNEHINQLLEEKIITTASVPDNKTTATSLKNNLQRRARWKRKAKLSISASTPSQSYYIHDGILLSLEQRIVNYLSWEFFSRYLVSGCQFWFRLFLLMRNHLGNQANNDRDI